MEKVFFLKTGSEHCKTDVFDTLVRKPHEEIFSMASFLTGWIGLSCHMGATFSKKVWNFEIKYLKFQESKGKSGNPDFGRTKIGFGERTKIKMNSWSDNSGLDRKLSK